MKKRTYLFKLRSKLLWSHSRKDINSILFDYNEYFTVGLSNGKTEEELIKDLGSPLDVVNALSDERDVWAPFKLIIRVLIGFMITFYTYAYVTEVSSVANGVGLHLLFTMISPIGLWLLLGGDLGYQQLRNDKTKWYENIDKVLRRVLLLQIILSIVIVLQLSWVAEYTVAYNKLPFGIANHYARWFLEPSFHLGTLVGVFTLFKIGSDYRRKFKNTLPLIFLSVGLIYSIRLFIYSVGSDFGTDGYSMVKMIFASFMPALLGLVLTLASYMLFSSFSDRGE
ncbi:MULTISPECIES: HAAS domain-containing protein [unclassified Fusibacter]|uniref:HAAS domain-containing protein n=1 Tax=unclassified Fusibacter TaxID=2624464 RepID=UPI0013E992A5|nr:MULTISPECIES: DUF1700 domain-containing protein [unclassified Fusibacter]MCK8059038.1 DUF1700 domain-containing protein [Fusibacter sp. A2]NPE22449.1 DUF1700 domain-containing protein [Fusibacter sp. A1]